MILVGEKCSYCEGIVKEGEQAETRNISDDEFEVLCEDCAATHVPGDAESTDYADRQTQYGRYIDCGPQAWDNN